MALLETNRVQNPYAQSLLVGAIGASCGLAVLLISTAMQLASSTGGAIGTIGSLRLFEITKHALPGGGFAGNLRLFAGGIAVYCLCWLGIACLLGFWRSQHVGH